MTHQFMYPKVTPVRQPAAVPAATAPGVVKPPVAAAGGDARQTA